MTRKITVKLSDYARGSLLVKVAELKKQNKDLKEEVASLRSRLIAAVDKICDLDLEIERLTSKDQP